MPSHSHSDLLSYAGALDLDVPRFAHDLQAEADLPKIQRDLRSGVRSGVNGTPTFFVNDERFDGQWNVDVLLDAVRTAADAADGH
jgi:protein-disulfide isomerase